MYKYVRADEKQTIEDRIAEIQDGVEDDFAYVMAGVEKLIRDGGESTDRALGLLNEISEALQGFITSIAGEVRE